MNKQEFLSASLPYGVKFKIREWSTNQKSGIYKLAGIYETGVVNGFNYDNHVTTDKHIPIIRPLSDLTKECVQADYNNGEPFVPIVELERLFEGFRFCILDNMGVTELEFHDCTCSDVTIQDVIPLFQQLIKWHFWPSMPEGEEVVYVSESFNPYK